MKDYKKRLVKPKNKIVSGMMYLLPIFILFIVIEKLWYKVSHLGKIVVHNLHLDDFFGKYSLTITTGLLLLLIFYVFGYLATLPRFKTFYNWFEGMMLDVIPGYGKYKTELENKINPKPDNRTSVLVSTPMGNKPGLLIDEKTSSSVVFFPSTTNALEGEVLVVDNKMVQKIDIDAKSLLSIMKKQGKGLPVA
ncbi:hypothetical protein BN863_30680 [Formosa agariphila KMM 3901]|uniref:DUF502 domain-containing protein n=1 Tax=Formosa agariphila (strain DSM 15362 / KCTC 12365 / LMG 23005 / KMM 3901 / M-2Alg 35-1) TaxID=1347342 RepID=T2KPX1_FORAG|nr:hypothetical protein [Formosa agariphila]CDF80780.1 hypothetical protein BN863_30680 [Formosa agariphila KMM 3901]